MIAPRTLGASGLRVSGLCLGTWQLGGAWGDDVRGAVRAIGRAFELGVTFFDTAYAYGEGAAERGLARGLGELMRTHRDELTIATKGGLERRGDVYPRNSEPAWLRETLQRSLRALQTDHVDLYLVHWPDPLVPFAEVAGVLAELVDEGLARHVGVSNFDVVQMEAFAAASGPAAATRAPIAVAQPPFNLLRREAERDALPYCVREGIGIVGWGALAQGLLTDAARTLAHDRPASAPYDAAALEQALAVVDRLAAFARERGCTLAQLAIAWVLAHPAGVVPIVGAQEPGQIESSVAALDVALTPDEAHALAALADRAPPQRRAVPIPPRDKRD